MAASVRDNYLGTEVWTAAPQKLQLLLIDAALRSANRARQSWAQERDDLAILSLVHAQSVLGQMLAAIDRDAGGDLAERVSALYEFIFRSLVKAGHRHDEQSLADAIRILEIERETWRQLCEQVAADRHAAGPAAPHARFGAPVDAETGDFTGGLSLEA